VEKVYKVCKVRKVYKVSAKKSENPPRLVFDKMHKGELYSTKHPPTMSFRHVLSRNPEHETGFC
jgi:hypothetical protein